MIEWLISRFGVNSLAWIAAFCLFSGGGLFGWVVNDLRWKVRYGERETEILEERIAVYEIARALEAEGEARAGKLLAIEAVNRKLGKEKDDAIRKLATNRACLGADLVGLLNAGADPGLRLSSPASGLARPTAASTADPSVRDQWATDADVALWARYAREQYDACRARIDALAEFLRARSAR